MEQTFSRRGFLKGAAAAALAVSAMGLTGCAGEDGPTTAVVLGDYKVDVDVRKSTRRSDTRNNKTTGILLPVVYITNQTGSVMELKLTAERVQSSRFGRYGIEVRFSASTAHAGAESPGKRYAQLLHDRRGGFPEAEQWRAEPEAVHHPVGADGSLYNELWRSDPDGRKNLNKP